MSTSFTIGEHDLVNILSKEELVSFNLVSPLYPLSRDVTVSYKLGSQVNVTPLDWIGIFPSDWGDICHPLTFQWAPVHAPDNDKPRHRLVTFPAKYIKQLHNTSEAYQFVYVSKTKQVLGVSQPFMLKPTDSCDLDHSKFREETRERKSQGDSSGQSESPVIVSSDDEWDFANQNSLKQEGSTTSELSDIVILSSSPSKELAQLSGKKDKSKLPQKGAAKTLKLGTEDLPTDSQNSDLEDSFGPELQGKTKLRCKKQMKILSTKDPERSPVISAKGKFETWIQNVADQVPSSNCKSKKSAKKTTKCTGSKAVDDSGDSKLLVSIAAKSHNEMGRRPFVVSDYTNDNHLMVPSPILDQLKIVQSNESDNDVNNEDVDGGARAAWNLVDKNSKQKIEVISDSSSDTPKCRSFNNKTSSALKMNHDTKAKKSKGKKSKKRTESRESSLSKDISNFSEEDLNTLKNKGRHVNASVVFDELTLYKEEDGKKKAIGPKQKSNGRQSPVSETKKPRHGPNNMATDVEEAEASLLDSVKRHTEKKKKRRSSHRSKESDGTDEGDSDPRKEKDEEETDFFEDVNDEKFLLENFQRRTGRDELKAIKKKYLQAQKAKTKKRKRLQGKNASQTHCNLAFLFLEGCKEEVKMPPPGDSGTGAAETVSNACHTQEETITKVLQDTSEQGFPALPSAKKQQQRSFNPQPEESEPAEMERDKQTDCEESDGNDPAEVSKVDTSEEINPSPRLVPSYLLDIMDALPTADRLGEAGMMDWKKEPQLSGCRISFDRFKAKYKAKFSKKQEFRKIKLKRKTLYLNAGILECVKHQLSSDCVETNTTAKIRVTPSYAESESTLEPSKTTVQSELSTLIASDSATLVPSMGAANRQAVPEELFQQPESSGGEESETFPGRTSKNSAAEEVIVSPDGGNTKRVDGNVQVLSYASVVRGSQEDQCSRGNSEQVASKDSITSENYSDADNGSVQPSNVAEAGSSRSSETVGCSIASLLDLPGSAQELVATYESPDEAPLDLSRPYITNAVIRRLESKAIKLREVRQTIRQKLQEQIETIEGSAPKGTVITSLSGPLVPLEGTEYMRGNSPQSPLISPPQVRTDSPPLHWPWPVLSKTPSPLGCWMSRDSPEIMPSTERHTPFATAETSIYLRPVARNQANKAFSCSDPPLKAPISAGLINPQRVESETNGDFSKTEQAAVLDMALATSLAENKDLKEKLRRLEAQLEDMETQLQQLETEQTRDICRSRAKGDKGKVKEIRHHRVPVCKSAGDLKDLLRSNVEIISLKSKVKNSHVEIGCLERQISSLKEALSAESKRASKAHLKWIKLKAKVKALKSRLKSYEEQTVMDELKDVDMPDVDGPCHDSCEYEPPRKKRRIEREISETEMEISHSQLLDSKKNAADPGSPGKSVEIQESPDCDRTPPSPDIPSRQDCIGIDSQAACPLLSPPRHHSAGVTLLSVPTHEPQSYQSLASTLLHSLAPYSHSQLPGLSLDRPLYWPAPSQYVTGNTLFPAFTNRRNVSPLLPVPTQTAPSLTSIQQPPLLHPPPRVSPGAMQQPQQPSVLPPSSSAVFPSSCQSKRTSRRGTPPHLPLSSPSYSPVFYSNVQNFPRQGSLSPPRLHRQPPSRPLLNSRPAHHREDSPPRAEIFGRMSTSSGSNTYQDSIMHPSNYQAIYTQSSHAEPTLTNMCDTHICWGSKPLNEAQHPIGVLEISIPVSSLKSHCCMIGNSPNNKAYIQPFHTPTNGSTAPQPMSTLAFASNAVVCPECPEPEVATPLYDSWFKPNDGVDPTRYMCSNRAEPGSGVTAEELRWRHIPKPTVVHFSNSPPTLNDDVIESQYQSRFMRQLVKDETNEHQQLQQQNHYHMQQQQQQQPMPPCSPQHHLSKEPHQNSQIQKMQQAHVLTHQQLHSASCVLPQPLSQQTSAKEQVPYRPRDRKPYDNPSTSHAHYERDQPKIPPFHCELRHFYEPATPAAASTSPGRKHIPHPGPPPAPCSAKTPKPNTSSFQSTNSVVELNANGLIGNPKDSLCYTCGIPFDSSINKRLIEACVAMHQTAQE